MPERGMTTFEKAVRAVYLADYPGAGDPDKSDTDAMMFEKYQDHYSGIVRGVLKALREAPPPKEDTIILGFMQHGDEPEDNIYADPEEAKMIFTAMIDTILNEGEKPE